MNDEFEIPGTVKPTIVIDRREKTPLVFTRLPSASAILSTGDYAVRGAENRFAVERKSLRDIGSCSTGRDRERFERALQRMAAFEFRRLLIIGSEAKLMEQPTVWRFVLELEMRYRVPVVFAATPEHGARLIERWCLWWSHVYLSTARQLVKANASEPAKPTAILQTQFA